MITGVGAMFHRFRLGRFVADYRDVHVPALGRRYAIKIAVTCRLERPVGSSIPTRDLLSFLAGSVPVETRTSSF